MVFMDNMFVWVLISSFLDEAMEKGDDISAEVDNLKEALEIHVEGCDVLKVITEPDDFEALPLQTHHIQFQLFQHHNPQIHYLPCFRSLIQND